MRLGLGVAAGPDPTVLAPLGAEAEGLGFDSIWSNDHPGGEGLAQLAAWAGGTNAIQLGVGVLALDRHAPGDIAARALELGLPLDRTVIGIGAGFTNRPLGVVRDGVEALRAALPGARVAVAAMGPGMCRLAGAVGDAVLLNWMTPGRAAWARHLVEEGAAGAGRDAGEVRVFGYVRAALGPDAAERLSREQQTYLQLPHYARHFEAMGAGAGSVGISASDPAEVAAAISEYRALDEPVVRVLAHRTVADVMTVARAAMTA